MSNVTYLKQWLDKRDTPKVFLDYLHIRPPTISPTAPENPIIGDLWWKQSDNMGGEMLCWNEKEYQWVPVYLEKEK